MHASRRRERTCAVTWTVALAVGFPGCAGVDVVREAAGVRRGLEGVVVEEVEEGSAFKRAGLRPGDVVWAWERAAGPAVDRRAVRGEVGSVFDWMWLQVEQAPRGTVKLFGERAGVERTFEVPMGEWAGKVRSVRRDRRLEAHAETRTCNASADAALAELGQTLTPAAEVAIWYRIGRVCERRRRLDQAEASYRSALRIAENHWGESLHAARMTDALARVAWHRGRIERAATLYRDAFRIREKLAPRSLELAVSLSHLGTVARKRRELESAHLHHHRALRIREKLAPSSLDLASTLSCLGNVALFRRQLEWADVYHQRALEIKERRAPESLSLAWTLINLGNVALTRHQKVVARSYYRRAFEISRNRPADSLILAMSLYKMGLVAQHGGQKKLARTYHERALRIREKLAPGSRQVVSSLKILGDLFRSSGRSALAGAYDRRALEILEELAPDSPQRAVLRHKLGNLALARRDGEAAGAHHQRALEITREVAPERLQLALGLENLGAVARARGELDLARSYYERASAIYEKGIGHLGSGLARSLNHLGELARDEGDVERAAALFERAIHTLEAQIKKSRYPHRLEANARAPFSGLYRNSIEALLRLNRPEEAFAALESFRARAFLALLFERDLVHSDLPEDLVRDRRRLASLSERTEERLRRLDPGDDAEQIDRLQGRLRELRRKFDANTEEIRQASPALAALRDPESLDLAGVRRVLDPGTVMLSYSVGRERADLFVLTREEPLRVHVLEIGEEDLRKRVERFVRQLRSAGRRDTRGRFEMAGSLYRKLVEPAAGTIEESERLLLVPDGPLHRLPFGALIVETARPEAGDRGWRYLVESRPLQTVLSGTVFAELRKRRRPTPPRAGERAEVALVAFGDPEYPGALVRGDDGERGSLGDDAVRAAIERYGWRPLPYSRTEVETIARLFEPEPVRVFLGKDATEERAKALGKDIRIVHFATHGLLDDDFPLSSALALTLPERFSEDRENGLLQAWEIFERVRLDADLVVLSACQTAEGQEQFGEGLIGLSRAFQYAGARSVLATLWQVPDRKTSELMSRFYRHLRSGASFDEALRAAQVESIGESRAKMGEAAVFAPLDWAAFQILGDGHAGTEGTGSGGGGPPRAAVDAGEMRP